MFYQSLLTICLTILTSCLGFGQEGKARIFGHIIDIETRQPLPFSSAILYYEVDSQFIEIDIFDTDQDARFEFLVDEGLNYKILGKAPEYYGNEFDIKGIRSRETIEENLFLELGPLDIFPGPEFWPDDTANLAHLTGKFLDKETGLRIKGEVIVYQFFNGELHFSSPPMNRPSEKYGLYLSEGYEYMVIATSDHYIGQKAFFINPTKNEEIQIDFHLKKGEGNFKWYSTVLQVDRKYQVILTKKEILDKSEKNKQP